MNDTVRASDENLRTWLQTLAIRGENLDPAIVDFSPGLTLVHGRSDTGKTYLADSIDYVFTASSKPFDDEDTGYDRVSLTAQTPAGKLQITRPLRGSKARIIADDPAITSGDYSITRQERSPDESLSDVWLRQLGVTEPRRILTSAYANPGLLTWRRFSDVFYLSEARVIQKKSIFDPGSTETLSALSVLLFDTNFDGYQQKEDPSDQKKRQANMSKYIGERIDSLLIQYETEKETVDAYEGRDMKAEFNAAIAVQEASDSVIAGLRAEASKLVTEQVEVARTQAIKSQELSRYKQLETKYLARIERLGLIMDGQEAHEHAPQAPECPFCHGDLPEEVRPNYSDAVIGELATVIAQLTGLREAIVNLEATIADLTTQQADLEEKVNTANAAIRAEQTPKLAAAQQVIRDYAIYTEAVGKADLILQMHTDATNDLREIDTEAASTGTFKASDQFPTQFFSEMSQNCQDILVACGFPRTETVSFSRDDFDIIVGGKKKRTHGKGYRAFYNTVVLMALRKYVHEHASHKPFLVVIDTPALGLDAQPDSEGLVTKRNEENRPIDGLQARLFQYFLDTQDQGQLIVVDNTKDTPALDYSQGGAKEYVFTADENSLSGETAASISYGLLPALVPGYEAHQVNQELNEQLMIDQWPEGE